MGVQSVGRGSCEHPGADYEVGAIVANRFQQSIQICRIVAAVAVHEHHDLGVVGQRLHGAQAGRAVPAPRFHGDPRATGRGFAARVIRGAVIGHDDRAEALGRNLVQHRADGGFFVERGNDQRGLHRASAVGLDATRDR